MAFMDMIISLFCVAVLLNARNTVTAERCFTFKGDSFLVFSPSAPYDNKNSAHFELEFKTQTYNGLLMYARGDTNNDTEALYIRGGYLHYHIFNTGSNGVGREFGAHFVSNERVDNNAWIKLNVFRTKELVSIFRHSRDSAWKTGIEFEISGIPRSYTDGYQRHNIDLSNTIYIGGYRQSVSNSVGNFTGQMRGIREYKNGHRFELPSLNYKSKVDLHCFDLQPQ